MGYKGLGGNGGQCQQCAFWYGRDRESEFAHQDCHRYPETREKAWCDSCGEWRERAKGEQDSTDWTIETKPEAEPKRSEWWACHGCGMLHPYGIDYCGACGAVRQSQGLRPCDVALGRRLYRIWHDD